MQLSNHGFWMSNLRDWLDMNGRINTNHITGKPPWKIVFPIAIWSIWKSRNGFVFNRKNQNPSLASEILKQAMEYVCCVATPRGLTRHVVKRVCWEKPPFGWVKLNIDGSTDGNPGLAGYGGLLRDDHGNWLVGFARRIGTTTSFVVELWGHRDDLSLCYNLNIPSIIVELDAKAIVDIFQNSRYENNIISLILDDCRQLMGLFQQVQVKHCYRQANRCVDMLARLGTVQALSFVSFDSPLEDVRCVLDEDCNGRSFNWICNDLVVSV